MLGLCPGASRALVGAVPREGSVPVRGQAVTQGDTSLARLHVFPPIFPRILWSQQGLLRWDPSGLPGTEYPGEAPSPQAAARVEVAAVWLSPILGFRCAASKF